MPSGINLVTGLPFDEPKFVSEQSILDAQLKELVLSDLPSKSAKHKGKKGTAAKGSAPAPAAQPAAAEKK